MTRLRDEEIKEQWGYKGKPKQWQDGFDAGMREFIPQIEKLQGEIERLTAREDEHLKDKELLNDEINKLTAKHERLVKEITPFFKRMEFPRYDENETNDYICNSGDFDKAMCAYKLALTEEGNV